ncbi:MAG: hypothetical protein R6U96_19020 [Promethearchaeia archaeon]
MKEITEFFEFLKEKKIVIKPKEKKKRKTTPQDDTDLGEEK